MAKKIQDGNQIVTNVDSNDNLTFSIKSSFIDSTPTVNSTNLVTSGGVKSALDINTTDIAAAVIRIANNETNVNTNTTKIGTLSNLTTTNKTNLVNAINELETDKLETSAVVNEASTDTDKTYSANYLNNKLVSVGTTAPTDGRKVWFKTIDNSIVVNNQEWFNLNNIEKYSTNEIKVGTWIDGKPLYRKVIAFTPAGNIPANTWTTLFNYTFTNLKQLIKSTVLNTDSTNTGEINWLTVQYFKNDNAFKGLNTRSITVTLPTNSLIIVEYTKTTD